MNVPVVFISYSHDDSTHRAWVLALATHLRERGIDVLLDQWDLSPGQDVAAFMESSITQADRVLMICTPRYIEKSEKGDGGVGYERLIVTGELVSRIDTKKFVPIIRRQTDRLAIPRFLGPRLFVDFNDDAKYTSRLEELAREILGTPALTKPPLGMNPYTGTMPAPSVARLAGPSGLTTRGEFVLDDAWFASNSAKAAAGFARLERQGAMELRTALHDPVAKSQLDLLNAVRSAEIRTFGWPIGVLLENREEFRPRPTKDGIVAEVAIEGKGFTGVPSYDYWALRNNGDFALLQSLFEDERKTGALFFDTRIVRVTESILFAAGLYENLGVQPDARISIRIGHSGLATRTITSANRNRDVQPATTREDRADGQVTDSLSGLREGLVDHVISLLSPMFMLFDFRTFERSVYEDIVNKFAQGHVG